MLRASFICASCEWARFQQAPREDDIVVYLFACDCPAVAQPNWRACAHRRPCPPHAEYLEANLVVQAEPQA